MAWLTTIPLMALALLLTLPTASAQTEPTDGAVVSVGVRTGAYPTLSRGAVVLVNAQRLVVTQEPPPVATRAEAPPAPEVVELEADRPPRPDARAVWVAGHWAFGSAGLSWVAGRYVTARAGYVFVPPRWASLEGEYLFFSGFFVPRGVYVRSHFNRYYYSGPRETGSRTTRGPYWPVGAPTSANRPLTSASARDPYWPVGARR